MVGFVSETDEIGGTRSQFDIDLDYRKYLKATDWYAIRFNETGDPIPEDIKQNRAIAREKIKIPFNVNM